MAQSHGVSDFLEEVQDDDFPTYFIERDGRLYHSHPTCPYPLPIDGPEQQRMNVEHKALFQVIGANFVGPAADVLVNELGRQKLALDFGTGIGLWPMEMGNQFPHVLFAGLDVVPIATRYPHPNVQFQIHDINERTDWASGTVDLVHARGISMGTRDYPRIIAESGRVLRPGGLFISGEWDLSPSFHPSVQNPTDVPALSRFHATLTNALLQSRGISPILSRVSGWLEDSALFTEISLQTFFVPVGSWPANHQLQRMGRANRVAFIMFMESTKALLRDFGMSEQNVEELYEAVKDEIGRTAGLVTVYQAVHARRL